MFYLKPHWYINSLVNVEIQLFYKTFVCVRLFILWHVTSYNPFFFRRGVCSKTIPTDLSFSLTAEHPTFVWLSLPYFCFSSKWFTKIEVQFTFEARTKDCRDALVNFVDMILLTHLLQYKKNDLYIALFIAFFFFQKKYISIIQINI